MQKTLKLEMDFFSIGIHEAWSYKEKKHKKITEYRKSI